MRFIRVDGELINAGAITDINFDDRYVDDPDHPSYQAWLDGRDFYGDHVVKKPIPRARVYVIGRLKPIEVQDTTQIEKLRALWSGIVITEI